MLRRSHSDLIIGGIWAAFLVPVLVASPTSDTFPIPLPTGMAVVILIMPIVFFGIVSYIGPAKSSFSLSQRLVSSIDARYGEHAWESFLVRLRPYLLFGLTSLLGGIIGLWRTYQDGGLYETYIFYGLGVSSGLAFAIAHSVLYLRRAEGIYPSYLERNTPTPNVRPVVKLPLKQALKTYWWTLIGIFALPAIMLIGGHFFAFEILIVLFFGFGLMAVWPVLSGRATYSFWVVAVALNLLGMIAAAVLAPLILK